MFEIGGFYSGKHDELRRGEAFGDYTAFLLERSE